MRVVSPRSSRTALGSSRSNRVGLVDAKGRKAMDENDESVTVVVIESSGCLMAKDLDVDTATTLIALISEDPADWDEAMSVWPRYRTPAVCEFVSSLPIEQTKRGDMKAKLLSADSWVAIDFLGKRVLTGGHFMPIGRDAAFAMVVDESGKQHCPLSVHLPPWWELHEGARPGAIHESRQSTIKKPHVERDVLYGDAFLANIAARVLDVVASDAWRESEAGDDKQARYSFTLRIHRDWLMTPREDLGGRMPRELLHSAIEWSDRVTWGQRLRFEDGGPMVALPDDWTGYATAPMGSQEMCVYFDLCRELIDASWLWCESDDGKSARHNNEVALKQLTQFLREVKDDWLSGSFEGGSPPGFIIQCDRRRVPRGEGVAIDGIDEVQSEQHVADCDCPICEMMADGMFGIGFTGIDGHHLELDEEFAFSMIETRQAWEEKRREDAEFHAEMDRKWAEREAAGETDDPLASAWSGINDDLPFPGDPSGQLKMAFMVAEIVAELETSNASRDEIKALHERFANYRRCDVEQRPQRASELKANLQSLADHYPGLVSKSADLQSRIDEAGRSPGAERQRSRLPLLNRAQRIHGPKRI